MKVFITNKPLWLLFGLLFFLNGCGGDGRRGDRGDRGGFPDCPAAGLSEEQQAQIREIHRNSRTSAGDREHRNEGRREAVEGGNEERRAAREKIQQQILDTVPKTEKQKTALAECFAQRRDRR